MVDAKANTLSPDEQIARGREAEKNREEEKNTNETGSTEKSFREKILEARIKSDKEEKKKKNNKEGIAGKTADLITAPARKTTSRILRYAWISMLSVINIPIALLYINLHIFLRWVLGDKIFCKLGDEWSIKVLEEVFGEAGKIKNRTIGLAEIIVVIFLDILLLALIGAILSMIYFLSDIYLHPLEAFWNYILKPLYNTLKSLFS
ncbi:MAG: hypothetical protein ABIG60_00935 [Patescibacteria group bacterium]